MIGLQPVYGDSTVVDQAFGSSQIVELEEVKSDGFSWELNLT